MPLPRLTPFSNSPLPTEGVKESLRPSPTFSNLTFRIPLSSTHCSSHSLKWTRLSHTSFLTFASTVAFCTPPTPIHQNHLTKLLFYSSLQMKDFPGLLTLGSISLSYTFPWCEGLFSLAPFSFIIVLITVRLIAIWGQHWVLCLDPHGLAMCLTP